MSDGEFHRLLDRLNGDAGFRERFQHDIPGAISKLAFSPAQRVAFAANDEDALRRLAGTGVGIQFDAAKGWFSRLLCTRWFCGPGGTRDWQCPKKP